MENGFMNKVIGLVLVLVIGATLVGGLLIPSVQATQAAVGDPVTLNNSINSESPNYQIWNGSNIVLSYDNTTSTYSVDGESQTWVGTSQRIIIASNDFAARNGGVPDAPQLQTQCIGFTEQLINKSFTFTVTNKEYTLVLNDVTYTGKCDWLVYAFNNGTSALGQLTPAAATAGFLTSTKDDVIVLGNIYTTGENDTFYSYYMGDLTVNEEYEDVSEIVITKTLAEGYTDIYNTTVSVEIGEESFTPFYILAPKTVTGHTPTGANYTMFGVIGLLGIVLLVTIAASAVRSKY